MTEFIEMNYEAKLKIHRDLNIKSNNIYMNDFNTGNI